MRTERESERSRRRFSGVYPVLYAFFDASGKLDHHAMRDQVEHCIGAGAHGITVLGLVTEVDRMDERERREVVEVVGDAMRGRVPYAVTIGEPTAEAQIASAAHARSQGADWVILQPPGGKGLGDDELGRHFGRVADAIDLPAGIQNNPVNLASSMSPEALAETVRRHENISLLKAEGWSVDIARVIEACEGRVDVFGGHGGLELLSLLRAGGCGLIPAPECVALQAAMFEALTSNDPRRIAAGERVHKEILPHIVLMTRSVGGIITYGKRIMARRLGLRAVHDRAPVPRMTAFGLSETERVFMDVLDAEERWLGELRGDARSPATLAV